MKESLRAQLDRMQNRLEELNAQLASEDIGKDISLLKKLNQEHAETSEVLDTYALWKQAGADLEAARQMREEPDMREFADEEIADAETRLQAAQERIEYLLLPRDPDDARNAILEIRAGTGGDESALFAGDLLRMYLRYAEHRGWQTEILSASESELGGYREVIVQVSGQQVYGRLRYESGAHRVQRVPVTESQGRIHTSACTVAVMAEAEPSGDIEMPRMDGFDLTKNVREHADFANVPIIMITSRTADKHRNHALSLGVDVFLGKPFSEDDLLRHVRSFASQRAPRAMTN